MAMRQGGHQVAQKSTTRMVPSNCFKSTLPSPEALGREKSRRTTWASPSEPSAGAADALSAGAACLEPLAFEVPEEQPHPRNGRAGSNANTRGSQWGERCEGVICFASA